MFSFVYRIDKFCSDVLFNFLAPYPFCVPLHLSPLPPFASSLHFCHVSSSYLSLLGEDNPCVQKGAYLILTPCLVSFKITGVPKVPKL